jgi:hypothetical protein
MLVLCSRVDTEILSQLRTNVAYYERNQRMPPDTATIWVRWGPTSGSQDVENEFMSPTKIWTGSGANGVSPQSSLSIARTSEILCSNRIQGTISVPQRVVPYPFQIPEGANLGQTYDLGNGEYNGYMFRRNFTFGLANPHNAQDGAAWASAGSAPTNWDYSGSGGTATAGDFTQVACAVNTFDQTVSAWSVLRNMPLKCAC